MEVNLLLIILLTIPLVNSSLYKSSDHVLELTTDTFDNEIYNKSDMTYVVQFYNSWCGHCISFAPVWKSLSNNIRHWSKIVKLVVVDCSNDINVKLCRKLDIESYPTIRTFWLGSLQGHQGENYKGDERDAVSLRRNIIKWIEKQLIKSKDKSIPKDWPKLSAISPHTKEEFINDMPIKTKKLIQTNKPIVVVVESDKSYVGREIILDMSYQNSVIILRMVNSSQLLLNELLSTTNQEYLLPLLLYFNHKDRSVELLRQSTKTSDKDDQLRQSTKTSDKDDQLRHRYVSVIRERFVRDNSNEIGSNLIQETTQTNQKKLINSELVFMTDLNNALRHSLFNEIASKPRLNLTQLNVIRNYLTMIELYFPFKDEKMRNFFVSLTKWLSKQKSIDDMSDFTNQLKINEKLYNFPESQQWRVCAGSHSRYRGYPCSMWLLFHTLTVNEYLKTIYFPKWSNLHTVLYSIRDYIKYFFGCTSCANHFSDMSQNLESELTFPNSSVLWLWHAHNRVNERLKGDPSEDPRHPKIIYPSVDMCPQCYHSQPSDKPENRAVSVENWAMSDVLNYLIDKYKPDNIVTDTPDRESHDSRHRHNHKDYDDNSFSHSSVNNKMWSINIFNRTDYSLILLLYFISLSLLIVLCIFLKIRRKRKAQRTKSLYFA